MAAERDGGPSARTGDAGSTDSLIDRLKQQLESAMESLEKPTLRHQRSRSASDLLESTSKSQSDGVASTSNSCSSVFSTKQLDEERKDKLYPIPPRRTKKMKIRSRSSSAISSLEQVGSLSTDKNVNAVFKRPLAEQRSNPELTRKVKPPRPPPPTRQIPPRTYIHLDSKTNQAENTAKGKHHAVVVDTRAQRQQRHRRASQPERPPLPYETFVPQKQRSHTNRGRQDTDRINGSIATLKDRQQEEDQVRVLVTPPPAEYEVVVPRTAAASPRKSSASDNIPTNESSTSFHPFPGPVRRREITTAAGGGDLDNLASRRNDHRESVAVPYEVPSIKIKKGETTNDEAQVNKSTTVLTKQQLQAEGSDDKESDSDQYAYVRDCTIGWWIKEDDSSEVDVGSEPMYIEMNPAVYIPPPKDYKPKKRPKEARFKR